MKATLDNIQSSIPMHNILQLGRTERLNDTLNPKFQREITVNYRFEEVQKLGFYVFDIDDNNNDVNKAEFLGKCDCNLGQVL